ncbi:hypothetical protein DCAR_0728352 [Daucus carota subsp. sativus]|uniref:Uncharacterized protein n=1 Tax=Daucus carota subsp. sativus TaxID=79200 RepID=A0A161Y5K7_DAUCS|nr:PREDICTED: nuclear transport factor 2-like [Daucus carota subsp. sativus]WOH08901.1 hypothetical protein DCAR_0728352 [Daucus carota subsp. sativus]
MDADADAVARAFVDHYYFTFDNRSNLGSLYKEASRLTFEGEEIQGSVNIVAKLTSLPQKFKHRIGTIDGQSSGPAGGILVSVDGSVEIEEYAPSRFSQVFLLMPTAAEGSYYVLNDIYRSIHG